MGAKNQNETSFIVIIVARAVGLDEPGAIGFLLETEAGLTAVGGGVGSRNEGEWFGVGIKGLVLMLGQDGHQSWMMTREADDMPDLVAVEMLPAHGKVGDCGSCGLTERKVDRVV